jgi:hypothetical protein
MTALLEIDSESTFELQFDASAKDKFDSVSVRFEDHWWDLPLSVFDSTTVKAGDIESVRAGILYQFSTSASFADYLVDTNTAIRPVEAIND